MNRADLAFGFAASASLFTVLNPVSAAPLFVSMTSGLPERERRRVARRASVAALATLLLFGVAGGVVFRFFGITTQAFQIAGGMLFVLMSVRAILGNGRTGEEVEPSEDPSIVPLAIPILAGPGAITTVVVLMGQARTLESRALVGGAMVLTMAASFAILLLAPGVVRLLGREGRRAADRLLALLTAVIGVQFVLDGIRPVAVSILRSAG